MVKRKDPDGMVLAVNAERAVGNLGMTKTRMDFFGRHERTAFGFFCGR